MARGKYWDVVRKIIVCVLMRCSYPLLICGAEIAIVPIA